MLYDKNKNIIRVKYIAIFILSALLVLKCSQNVADTGSGTNTGNAIIAGTLVDTSGLPVQNTRVMLIPETYNPVLYDSLPDSLSFLALTTQSLRAGLQAARMQRLICRGLKTEWALKE